MNAQCHPALFTIRVFRVDEVGIGCFIQKGSIFTVKTFQRLFFTVMDRLQDLFSLGPKAVPILGIRGISALRPTDIFF